MFATAKPESGIQSGTSLRNDSINSKDRLDQNTDQFFNKRSAIQSQGNQNQKLLNSGQQIVKPSSGGSQQNIRTQSQFSQIMSSAAKQGLQHQINPKIFQKVLQVKDKIQSGVKPSTESSQKQPSKFCMPAEFAKENKKMFNIQLLN